jgi:4a-hydroxytetrahydrobiopterin dehydratase
MQKLSDTDIQRSIQELPEGWELNDDGHLTKHFVFQDFMEPMNFANQVAEIAEAVAHHPNLHIQWGAFDVEVWTHDVDGLTVKDFTLAQEIETAHAKL